MQREYSKQRLDYEASVVKLCNLAQAVMLRHGRTDRVTLDDGHTEMLANSADHKLRIPTLKGNVDVTIYAHWFRDPGGNRHAIEAAVEGAFSFDGNRG